MNTLKKSTKHYSFSDSIHGKGGIKPKLMGPNFWYAIENISFWGPRKQEMVQSERRMTSFLLNFKKWSISHSWARDSSNIYKTTLIWDSITYPKVHYHIKINSFNMHINTFNMDIIHTYLHWDVEIILQVIVFFKLILRIHILSTFCEIGLRECHRTSLMISQQWFR